MAVAHHDRERPRRGMSANGMEYLTWGSGPRSLLFVQGGPGSFIPTGLSLRMTLRLFAPYVTAGYTVWVVNRRRHMPAGHTIADMADDHAALIGRELGGRVDVLLGESYGGMIAQFLAARHPDRVGHVVLIATGCRLGEWALEVDSRMLSALARGDRTGAGTALAEWLLPARSRPWLARLLGRVVVRRVFAGDVPVQDLRTEIAAEFDYDSRPMLSRISAPVLLLAGDRDRGFPPDIVRETAALIPDCLLVWYAGRGHAGTCSSRRIPDDVLAFVDGGRVASRARGGA